MMRPATTSTAHTTSRMQDILSFLEFIVVPPIAGMLFQVSVVLSSSRRPLTYLALTSSRAPGHTPLGPDNS